ncbi:hypothetical protein GY21_01510 [Cryobacterium roopkundense]|uniref:Putative membrane protein n=1 Tax=Cryobacterium roopkundense TaxID=1001240 RepID=A0A099JTQ3_9MICO|nr:hypothetical protein [Cryobacterium roopkundense]KGJ81779.1 hypothetical protein GY21_01510 [Cryobacterium roopkundense]MBB5642410.1 putative membrane protein [Cryobacterium roopkundense]
MTATLKIILSVFTGLVLGVTLVFLTLVAAVTYAFATGTTATVPGMLTAWFTTENNLPALNFEPNGTGLMVAVFIVTAIVVALAVRLTLKHKHSPAS